MMALLLRRLPCSSPSLLGHTARRPLAPLHCRFSSTASEAGQSSSQSTGLLVSVSKSKDSTISVISLQRPEAKNAISSALLYDLSNAVESVRHDEQTRAVIVRSRVPRVFCAGADLKERAKMSESDARVFVSKLRASMTAIDRLPQPTIACIDGVALGGGLELALACDFRIASPSAVVGLPETSLAIIPGAGGTQRLPRLVGLQRAKFLILTAQRLKGSDALTWGMVDFVTGENDHWLVDPNDSSKGDQGASGAMTEFDAMFESERADEWPAVCAGIRLAKMISAQGPVAIRAAKRALNEGMQTDLETGMDVERGAYDQVLDTHDRIEALNAFREKRKPHFTGK
ncbi:unnamed protein product [Vitrella brassicaformis CCMP3155]|uniref:Enoyl-CoA hydratase n=1 Tax=Vitrella brassicaformis (strain CCMP3155) TaxID=1169540 RepID=A0A0G4ENQ0_VITBC|nr:unnamed protein product [Vitrella brassicaformis CCMP3155]|mmetsp:Transcript_35840/g.103076  ORF Transcript_35840/g.103076 Transcript_35840/m.103076 type:complete len:344 (+) Transcript_35840:96-1127(+)|eukprot:CEL98587.1 unnamed protein product [Vitrella brassicaformis CCMP3155]